MSLLVWWDTIQEWCFSILCVVYRWVRLRSPIFNTGLLVYWFTGILVYWYTGILVYWYTGGVLFSVECCIRQLWCSSIIFCNINSIAHNHPSYSYLPFSEQLQHQHPYSIYSIYSIYLIVLNLSLHICLQRNHQVWIRSNKINNASPVGVIKKGRSARSRAKQIAMQRLKIKAEHSGTYASVRKYVNMRSYLYFLC